MTSPQIKLAYLASAFRIKAEITKEQAMSSDRAPADLVQRAGKKFESLKGSGEISCYLIYEERLHEIWQLLRSNKSIDPKEVISFTLAEGAPDLSPYLQIQLTPQSKSVCNITFKANNAQIKQINVDSIGVTILQMLSERGDERRPNSAQIFGSWLHAAKSKTPIPPQAIGACPPPPSSEEIKAKPYSILANKNRGEIVILIRDVGYIVKQMGSQKLLATINDAANNAKAQMGIQFNVLKKELLTSIGHASRGPEAIGSQLPLIILAASIHADAPAQAQTHGETSTQTAKVGSYPGAGKLQIAIKKGGLLATFVNFNNDIYKDNTFKKNEEWLINEIKSHGIKIEFAKNYFKEILARIAKKDSLEGFTIASGYPSKGGSKPFLNPTYKELPTQEKNLNEDKVNIRSIQQRTSVLEGQLVAEIKYTSAPVIGRDVTGKELEIVRNSELKIDVGEGIIEKEKGRYYAQYEGVPVVTKNSVSLSKVLVHKGDVNLKTGNIVFDGPVEITGNIDNGAEVRVTGDLKVNGSIRNAFVKVGGDIIVSSGITTGTKGLVVSNQDVRAEFIENSNVQCGGNIFVSKVIINSNIICGGSIEIKNKDTGLIAGGSISCRYDLITANFGFREGNKTILNVGVDWKAELSVRIRQKRIEKVQDAQTNDRKALREVMQKKKNQMSQKQEDRKEYYQQRLVKERALLEKLQTHLNQAKANLNYDLDSKALISETLFANIEANIGGSLVIVPQDMAGVALLGKRKQGSRVVSIEVALKDETDEAS